MTDYVTDTHPLLWHLTGDLQLSKAARDAFAVAERGETIIGVPTIVLGELLYIFEKHKAKRRFFEVVRRVEEGLNFTACPLDIAVVRELGELKEIRELHDRIIVATAKIHGADLITRDREIRKSGYIKTVW